MFLGIILGVLIYMSTLSNMLIKIFSKILKTLIKILEVPFKVISTVFSQIATTFMAIYTKITKKFANKEGIFENNGE